MSRGDNYVMIDKAIAQEFRHINRPYSRVEALVSHSINVNCGRRYTIAGYAKVWQWSRNKVRKFIADIASDAGFIAQKLRTDIGHGVNTIPTHYRQPVHLIDAGLRRSKDSKETDQGQDKDRREEPIKKNNNKKDCSDFLPMANLLKECVLRKRPNEIISSARLLGWADHIRLMVEKDGVDMAWMEGALVWYREHWNDSKYVPVIESGKTLREKRKKLENAMVRAGVTISGAKSCESCQYKKYGHCEGKSEACAQFQEIA